jgi:hypothetical protein
MGHLLHFLKHASFVLINHKNESSQQALSSITAVPQVENFQNLWKKEKLILALQCIQRQIRNFLQDNGSNFSFMRVRSLDTTENQ